MTKRGSLCLIELPPCFDAVRSAVAQALDKKGVTVVGSSQSILRIQEAFAGDPEFADARASGLLDLVSQSQLVTKLCGTASVPTMPTLDLSRQAALIGGLAPSLAADSAFAQCKHLPGFYEAAAATLQELRHERVRFSSLEMPAGKLRDLALLDEGLRTELENRSYCTLSDRIENLIAATPARPEEIRRVFWLPEPELPELRLQLIQWMVRAGVHVEVALETHPSNPGFFNSGDRLRARFPDAETRSVSVPLPPGAALFSTSEGSGWTGELAIVEASDDFLEAEYALTLCRKKIREDGLDAGQLVIFARSLEAYGAMLRSASDREGLPIYVDYPEALRAHPFTRFVLQCLRVVANPDIATVVALVRSDYGMVPRRDRRKVEETLRSLAREKDFWKAAAEEALSDSPTPSWFADVARWRRLALDGQRKPADWLRGLDMLLAQTPWLQISTPREEAARYEMVRALQVAMLSLNPHEAFGFGGFLDFVERAWGASEYRVRDQGAIRVVSNPYAIGDARAVIAVGIVEGRFPSRRAEDPVLLDRDRAALRAKNPDWQLSDSYARAAEDDRDFYRLVCSCADLTLCYPATIGESTQEPAAYLADLQALPGTRTESHTFSQRFPRFDESQTDRDRVASILWHREDTAQPSESIEKRVHALRSAHEQSKKTALDDEIVRAKLGYLPEPIRMAHFRSLAQCKFQYFARHKLRLRSARQDPLNRVLVNTIRRSNLMVNTEGELREEFQKSLNIELESLKGTLNEYELQVLRFSAPTTLDKFASVEMEARRQWGLVPVQVAPEDDQTSLRLHARAGEARVRISPSIDVMYKREATNDLVPMRIGWEPDDDLPPYENYLVLLMHPGDVKYMMFDAYNRARRTLYVRRTDEKREKHKFEKDLWVDIGPKQMRELRGLINGWMVDLVARARSGIPEVTPGTKHCAHCDLGSLCRAAPYADQAVDWTSKTLPEAEE